MVIADTLSRDTNELSQSVKSQPQDEIWNVIQDLNCINMTEDIPMKESSLQKIRDETR